MPPAPGQADPLTTAAPHADADRAEAPLISVVVVAYQSGDYLGRCLESLERQTLRAHAPGQLEVILWDNASTDGAPQAAAAAHPWVRSVEAGANLGFAVAVNRAAAEARGRWLALLNPDAEAEADWLDQLSAATERWPGCRSFTSRQLLAEDRSRLDGLGDVMSGAGIPFRGGYGDPDPGLTEEAEVFSPCGAAMLVDRRLFLDLGGFDARFFCYCEDVDFGYRLRLAGEPTLVVPRAVVAHAGSTASGGPRSEFAVFHGARNRLWLLIKDTPLLLLPVVLPLHLLAVAVITTRPLGRLQARTTWRALRAAWREAPQVWGDRRRVRPDRAGLLSAAFDIARAMSWDVAAVRRTAVVLRKPAERLRQRSAKSS